MNIRRIEKKDLPMIAELVKDNTIETRDDICFEHSKICLSEDGEILCFIVLRERSLLEFFNGNIPMDENVEYDEDYEEGEEWWVKEDIENNEKHYEVIAMYDNGKDGVPFNRTITSVESNNGKYPIGVLWTIKEQPKYSRFYNFNNIVWLDIPLDD